MAFMDLGQVNPGHLFIVLKRQDPTQLDCTLDEVAELCSPDGERSQTRLPAARSEGHAGQRQECRAGWCRIHAHFAARHLGDAVALNWPRKEAAFKCWWLSKLTKLTRPSEHRSIHR